MTCAREFVTQVCCSASGHHAAGHRFPTMKSAKQNRVVWWGLRRRISAPTQHLFSISVSAIRYYFALLHGAFCLVLARLSACWTLILPAGITTASRRDRPPSSGGVSRGNDKSDPRVLERRRRHRSVGSRGVTYSYQDTEDYKCHRFRLREMPLYRAVLVHAGRPAEKWQVGLRDRVIINA
jgi:hypothetical protein